MSSLAAARCQHIKVSGIQCGSPALRKKSYCFCHQQNRPLTVECYSEGEYATGEIKLPVFEDAHSIQTVIRQVVQMVLQKRIEQKTASLLLYALQLASSNLKRMELEKPQPAEVVTDPEAVSETPADQKLATRMRRSTANIFRPAQSKPAIAPDRKRGIAQAKANREKTICNLNPRYTCLGARLGNRAAQIPSLPCVM